MTILFSDYISRQSTKRFTSDTAIEISNSNDTTFSIAEKLIQENKQNYHLEMMLTMVKVLNWII